MMRAMVVERYGAPLQMIDLPEPSPGPRQVLVRILGCGVCRSDLKVVAGMMPFSASLPLPHVPGHEICGEVAALGAGASGRVGDRVVVYHYWACRTCAHCQAGEENLCTNLQGWPGFSSPGGFQEYLAVPDDCVLPLPAHIPPEHGGPLTCALGTAYHAVVSRGALRAGETAAVLGAGGVGLQVVQIARACGASVFAVDVHPHRLQAAREAGAEDAFPAGDAANAQLRDATAGRGADLVIDTVGHHGSIIAASRLARLGGRIVVVGYTTQPDEYPALPTDQVVLGQQTVLGSRFSTRRELRQALSLVARGLVHPVISGVVPLERANEALAMVREDRATGRVVVRVSATGDSTK
jgi:D-arabinose 1-dehydrogenase-like Zn-dependent alcohol dehydrogenase